MRRSIHFPSSERKVFKKHFLASVHSAIRFRQIDVQMILSKKDDLISCLSEFGYTDVKNVERGAITLEQKGQQPALVSHESSVLGLSFTNPELKNEIRLEHDKVIYSEFNYLGYEKFSNSFRVCFSAVLGCLGLDVDGLELNKVGLRKINSILIEPVTSIPNALSIFNTSLFSIPRSGVVNFESFRTHENVTVLDGTENELTVLKLKLTKPQDTALEATIDFDFVNTQSGLSLEKVFEEILPTLNQEHFDAFRWAVTDDLVRIMEE